MASIWEGFHLGILKWMGLSLLNGITMALSAFSAFMGSQFEPNSSLFDLYHSSSFLFDFFLSCKLNCLKLKLWKIKISNWNELSSLCQNCGIHLIIFRVDLFWLDVLKRRGVGMDFFAQTISSVMSLKGFLLGLAGFLKGGVHVWAR